MAPELPTYNQDDEEDGEAALVLHFCRSLVGQVLDLLVLCILVLFGGNHLGRGASGGGEVERADIALAVLHHQQEAHETKDTDANHHPFLNLHGSLVTYTTVSHTGWLWRVSRHNYYATVHFRHKKQQKMYKHQSPPFPGSPWQSVT